MFHGLDRPTAAPEYIKDSDVDKHMNYLKAITGIIRRFESHHSHTDVLLKQDNKKDPYG